MHVNEHERNLMLAKAPKKAGDIKLFIFHFGLNLITSLKITASQLGEK